MSTTIHIASFFFQTTKYQFKDKYFKYYYLKNIRYLYMYKSLLWIIIFLKSKKTIGTDQNFKMQEKV